MTREGQIFVVCIVVVGLALYSLGNRLFFDNEDIYEIRPVIVTMQDGTRIECLEMRSHHFWIEWAGNSEVRDIIVSSGGVVVSINAISVIFQLSNERQLSQIEREVRKWCKDGCPQTRQYRVLYERKPTSIEPDNTKKALELNKRGK